MEKAQFAVSTGIGGIERKGPLLQMESPFESVRIIATPRPSTASLKGTSPQSPADTCAGASAGVAFRHAQRRRHSGRDYFAAPYPACVCPCQRFAASLATDHA